MVRWPAAGAETQTDRSSWGRRCGPTKLAHPHMWLLCCRCTVARVVPAPSTHSCCARRQATVQLLLGADHPAIKEGRVAVLQALSGTGSLRVGAAFIARFVQGATVYISNPTWGNHRHAHATQHSLDAPANCMGDEQQPQRVCVCCKCALLAPKVCQARACTGALKYWAPCVVFSPRPPRQPLAGTSLVTRAWSGSTTGDCKATCHVAWAAELS